MKKSGDQPRETTVLTYLNAGLLEPIMSAEFHRGIAAAVRSNPKITPEVVETMRKTTLRIGQFDGIFTPIAVLITATMPRILEAEVNQLQALFLDPAQMDGRFRLTLGVGRFLDPDTVSPILLGLVGRIPRARAFAAAAIIWLLGTLPLVLQAMRGSRTSTKTSPPVRSDFASRQSPTFSGGTVSASSTGAGRSPRSTDRSICDAGSSARPRPGCIVKKITSRPV